MGSIRDDLKKAGYSKEEEYFYEVNRDLIERRRGVPQPTRVKKKSRPPSPEEQPEGFWSRLLRLARGDIRWKP